MTHIEKLRADRDAAQVALTEATTALNDALRDADPIKVGDRVERVDRSGNRFVAEVYEVYVEYDRVKVRARLLKKDGKVGLLAAPMWKHDWVLVK